MTFARRTASPVAFLLCLALALGGVAASPRGGARFRGTSPTQGASSPGRTVATQDIEWSLRTSLEAASLLRSGQDATAAGQRLAKIEASTWQTFQALPKNAMGRLAPRAVRYIAHSYFAKEHGWEIKGLEPHGMQTSMTEVHEVNILQDKAPALVEAVMEARQADRGLSLSDVVVMIAALERMIFDESISLLEAAYALNNVSVADQIEEDTLHAVLMSYLVVFEQGIRANLTDMSKHHALKARLAKFPGSRALSVFEKDAVHNFAYARHSRANPFSVPRFSFKEASLIVEGMADGYGKWQNTQCRLMQEELSGMASDGSGRVPLSTFYAMPPTSDYQFSESVEYLRKTGALDESGHRGPKVIIANYVTGASNCIASSAYYSVCCLSVCAGLMNEIESKLQAPVASPERLMGIIGNLSSSSMDTPRRLPKTLAGKLHAIADRHAGDVPIYGRLFAQWLHYAFPDECPYPHISENATELTSSHWSGKKTSAPAEERKRHIEDAAAETEADERAAERAAEPPMCQWSDEEVLPLHEAPPRRRGALGGALRVAAQLALLLVVLRIAFARWRAAAGAAAGGGCTGKGKGHVLPLFL